MRFPFAAGATLSRERAWDKWTDECSFPRDLRLRRHNRRMGDLHRVGLIALVVLSTGLSPRSASAESGKAGTCEAGLEAKVASILSPYTGRVPGASLLVLRDG